MEIPFNQNSTADRSLLGNHEISKLGYSSLTCFSDLKHRNGGVGVLEVGAIGSQHTPYLKQIFEKEKREEKRNTCPSKRDPGGTVTVFPIK